jgi:metal-sulfur cluster biosynthetic enzyme
MSENEKNPQAVNPHTGLPVPPDDPTGGFAQSSVRGAAPGATPGATPAAGAPASGGPGSGAPASAAPASAPSVQEIAVRSALETVMDPEIGLSVIDLGLIREVLFEPGRTRIKMMLTTPFCPYAPQLMAEVKQATMSVVPQECEVEIMPDAWSPDMMPDPGLLGFSY